MRCVFHESDAIIFRAGGGGGGELANLFVPMSLAILTSQREKRAKSHRNCVRNCVGKILKAE